MLNKNINYDRKLDLSNQKLKVLPDLTNYIYLEELILDNNLLTHLDNVPAPFDVYRVVIIK